MQLEGLMTSFSHYHYDLSITVVHLPVEIQFLYSCIQFLYPIPSEGLRQAPEQHFYLPPHAKRNLLDSTQ